MTSDESSITDLKKNENSFSFSRFNNYFKQKKKSGQVAQEFLLKELIHYFDSANDKFEDKK